MKNAFLASKMFLELKLFIKKLFEYSFSTFQFHKNFFQNKSVMISPLGCDRVKKKFIEKSIQLIKEKRKIESLEEKKLRYGLEAFYNLATKTTVLILLAILFDFVLELLLLTIVYSTLRLYGFGLHAKTSLQCWLTTIPVYIGGCLIIKYCEFPITFSYIIWIFGFLSFLFFAPADTPARPLIRKNKRIRAKILSLVILTVYLIVFIYTKNPLFHNTVLYALMMESIVINPLIYKLSNTPFNNYKSFQENMV